MTSWHSCTQSFRRGHHQQDSGPSAQSCCNNDSPVVTGSVRAGERYRLVGSHRTPLDSRLRRSGRSGDVDGYLSGLEKWERHALRLVIDYVAEAAPDSTEGHSYGLPAFCYRDKALLGFTVTKKHLDLYPFSPTALDSVKDRLVGFELSKGTVPFTVDHPIPREVVAEMVQARIAEIEDR